MSDLRGHTWKLLYASDEDDIVRDFYVPALARSDRYDRAVGFFNSSSLAAVSQGLDQFISRGGRMRIIASPNLPQEDLDAIVEGQRLSRLREHLSAELDAGPILPSNLHNLALLTWLAEHDRLDLKIAIRVLASGRATLYHKKVGVLKNVDSHGSIVDWLTFSGSLNETGAGWLDNAETFSVHRSWIAGQLPYAEVERELFESAWRGDRPEIWTWSAGDWLASELRHRFGSIGPSPGPIYVDARDQSSEPASPHVPTKLYDYQQKAVEAWVSAGGRGTFAMATGTGKTETALAAAVTLAEAALADRTPLLILVVVPLVDLVAQWESRASRFGFSVLRWDSSTTPAGRTAVRDAFRRTSLGRSGSYVQVVVTTADSLVSSLRPTVQGHSGHILVIGDEMHSLGTSARLDALPSSPTCTLGLSATPKRHHDDSGTAELLEYFGEPVVSISIKDAIYEYRALTPYRYHLTFAHLSDTEKAEFARLSRLIAAAIGAGNDPDPHVRARSNLVAHAEAKFSVLYDLMSSSPPLLRDEIRQIVYVGEGRANGAPMPSIDRVIKMLGNDFGMRVARYTAATPQDHRALLQENLSKGTVDALVAMKCLDEGVDIPEARVGVILASTQNPRQFVQRRGRILRLARGKVVADLYDVLILPPADGERTGSVLTLAAAELSRAYELADAAENSSEALGAIREAAISLGLIDATYPWIADSVGQGDGLAEWVEVEAEGGAEGVPEQ